MKLVRLPSWNTKHLDTATHVAALHRRTRWPAASTSSTSTRSDLRPSPFLPRWFGMPHRGHRARARLAAREVGTVAAWVLQQCEVPAVRFPDRTVVVSRTLQEYFREHYRRDTVTSRTARTVRIESLSDKYFSSGWINRG